MALGIDGSDEEAMLFLRVGLEIRRLPIGVEGGRDFFHRRGRSVLRDFDIPFQAARERRIGEVGGTDIGGVKARFAVEDVGFGMQACALGVVGDFDFCAFEPREGVDGLDISGAHVGGGDDAQLAAALGEGLNLWEDEDQAAPFDEGNEEVEAV